MSSPISFTTYASFFFDQVFEDLNPHLGVFTPHVQWTNQVVDSPREVKLLLNPMLDLILAQLSTAEFQNPGMIPKCPSLGQHIL
jgi:hypothetical protein